jgi:acetyl-CoA carboxylase carboxyl transferase subunit alpha
MLEHSFYSVISPEGCASILWKTGSANELAAKAQKLTAQDLLQLGIIDEIIPEPIGGAHRDKANTIKTVLSSVEKHLLALINSKENFKEKRAEKFINIGGGW